MTQKANRHPKRHKNMLKFALRNKLGDTAIQSIMTGAATKASIYGAVLGRHPTKRR